MKAKLLIAALAVTLLGMSSCSREYVDPRTKYPPHYRTYQDKDHGGMDNEHGGLTYPY